MKTEEAALSEIESIAKAFTQLENQQSQQITIIREKDDHISRLLADKTKIEQKLMLLHKEKDVVSNKALALTRQAQKWEELEAKLEADTKSKEIALEAASKELARAKTLISVHERKAQEAFQIAEELSLRQEKTSSKYNEVCFLTWLNNFCHFRLVYEHIETKGHFNRKPSTPNTKCRRGEYSAAKQGQAFKSAVAIKHFCFYRCF